MKAKYGFQLSARDGLSKSFQRLPDVGGPEEWVGRGMVAIFPPKLTYVAQEILGKLDAVTVQLDVVTKESAREVSILKADLESEKEARRGWQDKAATLRDRLSSMVCHSHPL